MPRRSLRHAAAALAASVCAGFSAPAAAHTFDFASHAPPRMALMFSMAWFGIPASDPQGAGQDPGWGNWKYNAAACGIATDPAACEPFESAGLQRKIASRRRPLAGIYSASGRDDESLRRIDLMLSNVRRPCDDGARLDAFVPQIDSVKFTSAYPMNEQSATWDVAYRATVAFLDEADAAGMKNAVGVGADATTYWHFGDNYGVSTQADRLAALEDDVVDMAKLADAHPSALRATNGAPILIFYVDSALATTDEWNQVLDGARATSGVDFYALGTTLNSTFFASFDALAAWVNLGIWANTSGASTYDHALAWVKQENAKMVGAVANFPGRVIVGGVTPGFDDFTEDWGQCKERQIPRDPAVLDAQFDYYAELRSQGLLGGLFFETWDDWTEGSEFEPDVTEGTTKLVHVRHGIGKVYGDPDDPAGDAKLDERWKSYGQARSCCFVDDSCSGAPSPQIDLSCPPPDTGSGGGGGGAATGSGGGATVAAGAGGGGALATGGGGAGDVADGDTASQADSGCSCRTGDAPAHDGNAAAALLVAIAALGARRRRTVIAHMRGV